jgi:hypothetical protein
VWGSGGKEREGDAALAVAVDVEFEVETLDRVLEHLHGGFGAGLAGYSIVVRVTRLSLPPWNTPEQMFRISAKFSRLISSSSGALRLSLATSAGISEKAAPAYAASALSAEAAADQDLRAVDEMAAHDQVGVGPWA